MALEAVVYPPQDPFGYNFKDYYSLQAAAAAGGGGCYGLGLLEEEDYDHKGKHATELDYYYSSSPSIMMQRAKDRHQWDPISSPEAAADHHQSAAMDQPPPPPPAGGAAAATTSGRIRKRRRTKSTKNKEEIENQRMTHIAVERNRRKQMNEYLAVLRSLMPPSYVQRGDQASIVGGAINFVKELEQLLQTMEAHKKSKHHDEQLEGGDHVSVNSSPPPFSNFFAFPQFTTRTTQPLLQQGGMSELGDHPPPRNQNQWAMADIEVTMVESHANLKILSKKRHRQLLKLVAGLQSLRLTVLHLNVTAVDQMVLYSVSVKVEEGCHLNTVDEIAAAVNQMLQMIEKEAAFS